MYKNDFSFSAMNALFCFTPQMQTETLHLIQTHYTCIHRLNLTVVTSGSVISFCQKGQNLIICKPLHYKRADGLQIRAASSVSLAFFSFSFSSEKVQTCSTYLKLHPVFLKTSRTSLTFDCTCFKLHMKLHGYSWK